MLAAIAGASLSLASPHGGPPASQSWSATWSHPAYPSATASATPSVPSAYLKGFNNPVISHSAGGAAICIQGNIPVTATTTKNIKLNLDIPANQSVATEIFVNNLQINSTYLASITQGTATVSGTYDINAKLCYPAAGLNATTLQFLIHGIGFDKSYWDFLPGYSYVDVAAQSGYATFSYDRLGVGLSAHPDPINVVQASLELEIGHSLITYLRAGNIASTAFKHIVGAGHSYGSIQTNGLTVSYPADLDAAVLTGYASVAPGIPTFMSALNAQIANQNNPRVWGGLNNGYLVCQNIIGNQFDFFRFPYFDPALLVAAEAGKKEFTFGELFSSVGGVATQFTGPVDIVNGATDWPFCQGNCLVCLNVPGHEKINANDV